MSTPPMSNTADAPIRSAKEFSDALTLDLTDEEIKEAFTIIMKTKQRWQNIFQAKLDPHSATFVKDVEEAAQLVERFERELQEELGEKDLTGHVEFDQNDQLTIVLDGALESHVSAKWGLDHEKKEVEVKRAGKQPFLGADKLDV